MVGFTRFTHLGATNCKFDVSLNDIGLAVFSNKYLILGYNGIDVTH